MQASAPPKGTKLIETFVEKSHLVMVTSVSSVPIVASFFSVLVKTRKGIHSL